MNWLLLGLLIGALAAGWFGFERQRQVYDQLVATLAADRDAARNETKVFRSLLFPSITRAEENLGDVSRQVQAPGGGSPVPRTSPKDPSVRTSARSRARISSRAWFNVIRKQSNTPQIKTDALADAIKFVNESQKVQSAVPSQEKSHG